MEKKIKQKTTKIKKKKTKQANEKLTIPPPKKTNNKTTKQYLVVVFLEGKDKKKTQKDLHICAVLVKGVLY